MGPERAQGRTGGPQSLVIKTMPRGVEITQNWQQERGVEGGEGVGGGGRFFGFAARRVLPNPPEAAVSVIIPKGVSFEHNSEQLRGIYPWEHSP